MPDFHRRGRRLKVGLLASELLRADGDGHRRLRLGGQANASRCLSGDPAPRRRQCACRHGVAQAARAVGRAHHATRLAHPSGGHLDTSTRPRWLARRALRHSPRDRQQRPPTVWRPGRSRARRSSSGSATRGQPANHADLRRRCASQDDDALAQGIPERSSRRASAGTCALAARHRSADAVPRHAGAAGARAYAWRVRLHADAGELPCRTSSTPSPRGCRFLARPSVVIVGRCRPGQASVDRRRRRRRDAGGRLLLPRSKSLPRARARGASGVAGQRPPRRGKYTDGQRKTEFIAGATALLNTSIHEGLPVTFQEALACAARRS